MSTIYLVGSEDVRRAGNNISGAADQMQRAAAEISGAVEQLSRYMENWLERLEALKEAPPKPRYFLANDAIFQRLKAETKALFERYPEDDGIMEFDPERKK